MRQGHPFERSRLLAVLIWVCSAASHADALSLSGAYDLAQSHAPQINLARLEVEQANAQRKIARGALLPNANLFGQFSKNEIEYQTNSPYADQDFRGERYGVQVSQTLIDVAAGLEASRLSTLLRKSKKDLEVAQNQLVIDLVTNFLNVGLADREVEQYGDELVALEAAFAEATALYDVNLVPVTQLLETEARLDAVRADVIMASGNAQVAREKLSELIGQPVGTLGVMLETIPLMSSYATAEEAAMVAMERNPVISAAEAELTAARQAVEREKARWFPQIDLTFSYQHSDVGFDNLQTPARDTSTLAVGFSYPLFEGGAKFARLESARIDSYAAETRLESERRTTETRVRTAWLNFQTTSKRLAAARRGVVSASTNADAAQSALQSGTARVSDVLLALSRKTRAGRDYTYATFQNVIALMELELSTGVDPDFLVRKLSSALHDR